MRALRAAAEVARGHGVRVDEPAVVSDISNLIVHLAPAPVVARVTTSTGTARRGREFLEREAAVAGYLARAGAPVVAPSPELPPGPHGHDGLVMTFWEHVPEPGGELDPDRAGRGLRECHEALAGFPGELPQMSPLREAEENLDGLIAAGIVGGDDGDLLQAVAAVVIDRIERMGLPARAVHGDAHLGNVVNSADGPLWNDWEDTFRGPLAWDLACLHFSTRAGSAAAARAAFGDEIDDDTLQAFLDARRFQVTVWAGVVADETRQARELFDLQLARYREQA